MKKNIILVSIIVILLDQISKFIVSTYEISKIVIIKNFFNINLVHNKGAAWGIFNNKTIFNRYLNAPEVVKLEFNNKMIKNIQFIEFEVIDYNLGV